MICFSSMFKIRDLCMPTRNLVLLLEEVLDHLVDTLLRDVLVIVFNFGSLEVRVSSQDQYDETQHYNHLEV